MDNKTTIETRLLMELVSAKTNLDSVMRFLKKKQEMFCGLTHGDVEALLIMFGKENDNA